MAFAVLFVSLGWVVKFHYCTAEHHLSGNFSEAAESCLHCLEHEHEHEAIFAQPHEIQYDAKCCCEDFESKIQFVGNYVFSLEKQLVINLQSFVLPRLNLMEMCATVNTIFNNHSTRKTLMFLSGRERIVYFSSLKLNPMVF